MCSLDQKRPKYCTAYLYCQPHRIINPPPKLWFPSCNKHSYGMKITLLYQYAISKGLHCPCTQVRLCEVRVSHPNLSVRASHCQKQMVPSAPVEDRYRLEPLQRGENCKHNQLGGYRWSLLTSNYSLRLYMKKGTDIHKTFIARGQGEVKESKETPSQTQWVIKHFTVYCIFTG